MSNTPATDPIKAHYESEFSEAGGETVETSAMTLGETVTAALARKARALHAEGQFFDKSLPQVRTMLRQNMPALAELERSADSVPVALNRIQKVGDPDFCKALEFLDSWG